MFLVGFYVGFQFLLNWIWRCWFLVEGRKLGYVEKIFLSKVRFNNKISRCVFLQMLLVSRCQKYNVQVYYYFVCEQYFFLRTLCLVDFIVLKVDKKRKKLKKFFCEFVINLVELFVRLVLDINSICFILEVLFMYIFFEFSGSQYIGLYNLLSIYLNFLNGVFRLDIIFG